MSGLINDFLRTLIAYGIRVTGLFTTLAQRSDCRIPSSSTTTTREYAIDEQTPVLSYGREIIALINQAAAGLDDQVQFARRPVRLGLLNVFCLSVQAALLEVNLH